MVMRDAAAAAADGMVYSIYSRLKNKIYIYCARIQQMLFLIT